MEKRSPTFNIDPGDSVVDAVVAHPLSVYTPKQREYILAKVGEEFKAIAEAHGLKYFSEGTLMTETMTEVPSNQTKEKLQQTLDAVVKASGKIQEKAKEFADKMVA